MQPSLRHKPAISLTTAMSRQVEGFLAKEALEACDLFASLAQPAFLHRLPAQSHELSLRKASTNNSSVSPSMATATDC